MEMTLISEKNWVLADNGSSTVLHPTQHSIDNFGDTPPSYDLLASCELR